jgi:GntR family transcriptional regulator
MGGFAPKYQQIAEALRNIQEGSYEPGERLPAETALAERFKVSLPTIRQAVGVLRSQGVVESKHGIGTFVQQDHRLERRSRCRYGRTRAVHRPRPHVDQHLLLRASKVLRLQAS